MTLEEFLPILYTAIVTGLAGFLFGEAKSFFSHNRTQRVERDKITRLKLEHLLNELIELEDWIPTRIEEFAEERPNRQTLLHPTPGHKIRMLAEAYGSEQLITHARDIDRMARVFFMGLRDLETLEGDERTAEKFDEIFERMNQKGLREVIELARGEAVRMIRKINPNVL